MASCGQREYDSKELGEDRPESPEHSSDESPEECRETNQIESHFTSDEFLRRCDSDEESFAESDNNNGIQINSGDKHSDESQAIDAKTESKDTVVVSSNSTGDSLSKTQTQSDKSQSSKPRDDRKPKNYKMATKWGESVGITDSKGRPKRLVNLSEVKNYIPLKMRYKSEFKFYFSLIDSRYPQRFRSYGSEKQRWRMRYNVFVDGLFDPMKKFESIVHVGEIIIYFDISKSMSHPYYANCSFYANYSPMERNVDTTKLTRLIFRLHDVLTSKLMLQLKFPIDAKAFRHTDQLYSKFKEHQKEMMDELLYIQSRQWSSASKWLSIDPKRKNDKNIAFGRLSIDYKTENRKSDDWRRKRSTNGEERVRSVPDNRFVANRLDDFQHNKRGEDRTERRFSDSQNQRRGYPSSRRTSDQKLISSPLRDMSSGLKWADDRIPSNNLPQKTNQRRSRNSDRMEASDNSEIRPFNGFRGGRREERRSPPKTRRH